MSGWSAVCLIIVLTSLSFGQILSSKCNLKVRIFFPPTGPNVAAIIGGVFGGLTFVLIITIVIIVIVLFVVSSKSKVSCPLLLTCLAY